MAETATADIAAILADYVPKAEYEGALEALNATIEERDAHKAELTKHTGRLTELEGKLRAKASKDAYAKVAEKLKIDPDFRDHVYELAKVPADADEPDLAAIEKHVSAFVKEHPRYTQQAPPRPRTIEAGEGSSRGKSTAPGEPEFRVSRRDMNNALFMRDNQSKVAAAAKAGLLCIDDD